MTKEQVIKEAYGEYWEELKELISDNGWISFYDDTSRVRDIFHAQENISVSPNDNNNWRPKSLQGIETNNGWIKIESKEDLPHNGYYEVIKRNSREHTRASLDNKIRTDSLIKYYSHYKPIENIDLPLY